MADKARSNNRGPILSSVTPTEDHTTATARPSQIPGDFDRHASDKDKKDLSLFMMAVAIDSNGQFIRSPEHQAAIERAYQHYKNEIEAANSAGRDSTIADRDSDPSAYDGGITFTGRSHAGSVSSGRSTVAFGDMGRISIGEKQNRVNDVLADAARANGINIATMRGMWHVESRFSSIREVSSTGCSGPWQFTQGTWAEMILKHGDEIAARLSAQGHTEDAAIALRYHNALVNREIRVGDAGLQSQRFNGHISTYAAAHYMADIARRQGINAMDVRNGGQLYAAYNVGEGSLDKLQRLVRDGSNADAMGVLGRVARLNPMFYQGGATGAEALANYQAAVENGTRQYSRVFGAEPAPRQAAAASTTHSASTEQPRQTPFNLRPAFQNAGHETQPSLADRAVDVAANLTRGAQRFMERQFNFDGH